LIRSKRNGCHRSGLARAEKNMPKVNREEKGMTQKTGGGGKKFRRLSVRRTPSPTCRVSYQKRGDQHPKILKGWGKISNCGQGRGCPGCWGGTDTVSGFTEVTDDPRGKSVTPLSPYLDENRWPTNGSRRKSGVASFLSTTGRAGNPFSKRKRKKRT